MILDVANVSLMVEKMLESAQYFEKNNIDRVSCNQSTAAAVASVEVRCPALQIPDVP